jgi:hypothetical protein
VTLLTQNARRFAALAAFGLAGALGACAGGFNPSDINLPKFQITTLENNPTLPGEGALGPVPPDQFVNADGSCAAGADNPGGGVGLGMSECQVVGRVGVPENVEITANERGQRAVTLTYIRGARPGIYRFVTGRLKVIEAAPAPPEPPKPVRVKKATKKVVVSKKTRTPPPPSSSPPPAQAPPPDAVWPPPPR